MKKLLFALMLIGCGNPCADLRVQCNACAEETRKLACTNLANAGVLEACTAAIDQGTYSGKECKDRCAELKPICDACRSTDCQGYVDRKDSSVCGAIVDSMTYQAGSSACM